MREHNVQDATSRVHSQISLVEPRSTVLASFSRHAHEYFGLALARLDTINESKSRGRHLRCEKAGERNVKTLITSYQQKYPTRTALDV